MRSRQFLTFECTLALAVINISAFAHGGGHAPPTPPPPPPSVHPGTGPGTPPTTPPGGHPGHPGGPTTPTGPTGPKTPYTPPTGGPKTPGPTPGPSTPAPTGGAPTPTGGGPMGGPVTGMMDTGPNLESWHFWWAFNKDRFLRLREAIGKLDGTVTSAAGEDLLTTKARPATMHPTREQLAKEVTPPLLDTLQKETSPDILNAAMIAVAKIGEEPDLVLPALKKLLSHNNTTVVENAALSIGILGAADGISILKSIYEDTDEGRAACGKAKEVPWRVRTTAAYGLGILGAIVKNPHHQTRIQDTLTAIFINTQKSAHRDVHVASVLALAMLPDRSQTGAATLEKYFNENHEREETICAHIAPVVARLLQDGSIPDRERYANTIVKMLTDPNRKIERLVRPGLAIALGRLTRAADPFAPSVAETLRNAVEKDISKNPETAYMSIISLGEIAGTSSAGNDIEKFLLEKATASGGRVTTRAWAAMGLGIEGFLQFDRRSKSAANESNKTAKDKDTVAQALVERMAEMRDPSQLSAFAIALGLRKANFAAPKCLEGLDETRVDDYRGYFALALGMMGSREHATKIQEHVKNAVRRPAFFQQTAIGLALLGDKSVVPLLIGVLRDAKNQAFAVQSSIADSLGYVGDYRAVKPLLEVLRDDKKEFPTSTRTFAAVALGQVGDKDDEPWNAKISKHLNYFAFVETLTDLIWEM